jgi:hypothetical protein
VVVTLTDTANYDLGAETMATVTITDDETGTVTVVATDAVADEAGPAPGTVTVGRSPGSTGGGS